jgi:hypothetical protein
MLAETQKPYLGFVLMAKTREPFELPMGNFVKTLKKTCKLNTVYKSIILNPMTM